MKKAVLSIDVEDWFHLDYFNRDECDTDYSMMDGLETYLNLINSYNLPSSFFVLGEIAEKRLEYFTGLSKSGYDISSHGWDHTRPMTMTLDEFENDIKKSCKVLNKINNNNKFGYRAPCFSLDKQRAELIKRYDFSYSSSRIDFTNHPLYGSLDINEYEKVEKFIYKKDSFFEFELSTTKIYKKTLPICGGGYLRILPWQIMKKLVHDYLLKENVFFFYIHPFELSNNAPPKKPISASRTSNLRFKYNLGKVESKFKSLIELIDKHEYEFCDFVGLREEILIQT
tara:strand:- start:6379 stop:7230 length:852 start_codon:yes stop_codon:yes gene_type:complete